MTRTSVSLAARALVTAIIASLCACAPADDASPGAASNTTEPETPLYISSKPVSTDCGVEFLPDPPPGFARRPNDAAVEMPPMITSWQAVGADRPVAETDAERVEPGYVVIEPGSRKPAYIVNIEKEVVGAFENDYFSFTQLQADGSRLASSNMFSDSFQNGGGHRGCIEEYAADGSLNWRLRLESNDYIHHHDVVKLGNGNILAVVWERVSAEQAIELGRNPEHVAENGSYVLDGSNAYGPTELAWKYAYDDGADGPHMLFRANKYPADHPAVLAIIGAAN